MSRATRAFRHLFAARGQLARDFPASALDALQHAISEGEREHSGEIVVAIEPRWPLGTVLGDLPVRERAEQLFAALRVWDTEGRSGVLIYVLLAEHRIEIVADRGIARRVPAAEWTQIAETVAEAFAQREPLRGLLAAIERAHALCRTHFPAAPDNPRELSDRPIVL